MSVMRFIYMSLVCWLCALPAFAQDDDKGFLTRTLESSLAGEGRDVQINGFRGALSKQATVQSIVISDDEGVWLTLTDLILQLNRSALLRGRVEIEELSAKTIELARAPIAPESEMPTAESQGFKLPELPVSIDITSLRADKIILGEPLLGEKAEFSLDAALSLINGEALAVINAERTDGKRGVFVIDASFASKDSIVNLDVSLSEGAGGIAARLLNIPENPSVDLKIQGSGPLNDLTTNLSVATNGIDRLKGTVSLLANAPSSEGATVSRAFNANINGDVTALFAPQFRPFFGEDVSLKVKGTRSAEGSIDLSDLGLKTDALQLAGKVTLNRDFWPVFLDVQGSIRNAENTLITLPVSGDVTQVRSVDLAVKFDQENGDAWTGKFDVTEFNRADIEVQKAILNATGTLKSQLNTARQVTADLALNSTGIKVGDASLQSAIGDALRGNLKVAYVDGQPVKLTAIDLLGEDYGLSGDIEIGGLQGGLETIFDLALRADDLSRFSEIASNPLAGEVDVEIKGTADLGGKFAIAIDGIGAGLQAGQEQVDKLLRGQTKLSLKANRNEVGTRIESLTLSNPQLSADASGLLTGTGADLKFAARLTETKEFVEMLAGPATVSGSAKQRDGQWSVDIEATGPFGATATVNGLATGPNAQINFKTNLPNVQPLVPQLKGAASIKGAAFQSPEGWRVDTALTGPYDLTAQVEGRVTGGSGPDINFTANLPNIGPLVPNISGPLGLSGSVKKETADLWRIQTNVNGPGGTSAQVSGTASGTGALDIKVNGDAPLALANPFITPRSLAGTARFDLALRGQPKLSSLSGTITTNQARLSAPTLRIALKTIDARVGLANGRANIDLNAQVSGGGNIVISGPVGLTGNMPANLRIALNSIGIQDPTLYKTTLDGRIGIDGALLSNARISGQINVGESVVTIPSSGVSSFGTIPHITHIDASTDVRRTLSKAGLNKVSEASSSASSPGYPLDITIDAPQKIFVRGRGLDAELGGRLRLTGTTNNIVSTGRFELVRGRLDILSKRFNLDEGTIQLQGDFDPFIRFVAITQTSVGTASVIVDGSASNPDVRFESSPESPQDEVLAQIFFGRDVSQISALQALQLANAVASLAGRGGEGIVSKLRRGFALDDLDITTDEDGNAGLRAGKYISENIYTDVTVGTQNNAEVSLNIDLTPNIKARGKVNNTGETSLGIFFEKDY